MKTLKTIHKSVEIKDGYGISMENGDIVSLAEFGRAEYVTPNDLQQAAREWIKELKKPTYNKQLEDLGFQQHRSFDDGAITIIKHFFNLED